MNREAKETEFFSLLCEAKKKDPPLYIAISAMVFSSLSDRDDKNNYSAMLSRFTHEELTKAISAIREVVDKEPVLARFADGGIDLINSYLLGVIV